MIDLERFELLCSAALDEPDRADLREQIGRAAAESPELARVWRQWLRLEAGVGGLRGGPAVDWGRLHGRLASAVSDASARLGSIDYIDFNEYAAIGDIQDYGGLHGYVDNSVNAESLERPGALERLIARATAPQQSVDWDRLGRRISAAVGGAVPAKNASPPRVLRLRKNTWRLAGLAAAAAVAAAITWPWLSGRTGRPSGGSTGAPRIVHSPGSGDAGTVGRATGRSGADDSMSAAGRVTASIVAAGGLEPDRGRIAASVVRMQSEEPEAPTRHDPADADEVFAMLTLEEPARDDVAVALGM